VTPPRGRKSGAGNPPPTARALEFYPDWTQRWRKTQAHGDMIVVRYADDAIVGFQHRADAERFLTELRERLAKLGLELHPEKTRLLEFGPFAAEHRQRAGKGKPETFNFLGFTHICGKKRNGRFTVVRQTIRERLQAKLGEVKAELRRRMHAPIPVVGAWLGTVVGGHLRYYGVPMNWPALVTFRFQVGRLWYRTLRRRGQRRRLTWERMRRLIQRWLPPARITHPYPLRRLGVVT
jgi:RNA-directed DNA polymerase